jgi:hypothetical protein
MGFSAHFINEEKVIALVPCGFFDEKDYISELN